MGKSYSEKIAFAILVILAFAGAMFLGTLVHELSHWHDLHAIVIEDSISLFNMPTDGISSVNDIYGKYSFILDESIPDAEQKLAEIDKYTEFKAYTLETLFFLLIFFCPLLLVLWKRYYSEKSIQIQDLIEFSYQEDLPKQSNNFLSNSQLKNI
jgi:hypothetical protein